MSECRNELVEENNNLDNNLAKNIESNLINGRKKNLENRDLSINSLTESTVEGSTLERAPEPNGPECNLAIDLQEQDYQVSLSQAVETSVSNYLIAMQGQDLTNLYDILLQEVEAPLLTVVMRQTAFNQSRAAKMLGLNRGTLRKKLKRYDLL